MSHLSKEQIETFWSDGFVVIPNAITPSELQGLRDQFAEWTEESRSHSKPYGQILDGRPRFDLETDHSAQTPALRRVSSPTEVSEACEHVTFDSAIGDYAADLIGPNIRFHHAKFNAKFPGSKTTVKWHQDFPFDPHTNDDQITALLFVDDVTPDNGPLLIVPGSHKGPLHSHWQNGAFTGAISDADSVTFKSKATSCTGAAGTLCLMHVRASHASEANTSDGPRNLYINTYAAADGIPLMPIAVPSKHAGRIVRGVEPNRIRSTVFDIEIPEVPKTASFFDQQTEAS
jgi:phytanoyl-CoA hydroxylase